ncbi:MAG: metallophosphoesterase [Myxococcales bacterium]|nr:MAG: metallophosphoesterase [Myxococcales bacterium]
MSVWRWLVFLVVVSLLSGGLHFFLWARLVRDPKWPIAWTIALTVLIFIGALSFPLTPALVRVLPKTLGSSLAWFSYTWTGLLFIWFVILLFNEGLRPLVALLLNKISETAFDASRRAMLSRGLAGFAGLLGLGLGGVALWEGTKPVRIKKVPISLSRLSADMHGFRIVQLTDIHVGPTIGLSFIEEIVDKSNRLQPDLVAITGDLVDGSVEELGPIVARLSALRAKHGVYFVTGNHEYYSGASAWVRFLETQGIRVLRNERVRIEHQGAKLDIAGIDDFSAGQFTDGHKPDLKNAMHERDPEVPVVLLAHQPRAVHEAAELDVDLQLSGHTHGGQMIPFNYLVHLQQPYVSGLHKHGPTQIYVSSGTGYWGPPMRLGIPAEITEIELRSMSRMT